MIVTLDEYADFRTLPGLDTLFKLLTPFGGSIDGKKFSLPVGFVTDGGSIPKRLQGYIARTDNRIFRPALPHDWFYQHAGLSPDGTWSITRAQADTMLREAMRLCGASAALRWNVWIHVRIYGFASWSPAARELRAHDLRAKIKRSIKIQNALK